MFKFTKKKKGFHYIIHISKFKHLSGKYSPNLGTYSCSHQNYLQNQMFIHTDFHYKGKLWSFYIETSSLKFSV